MNRKERRARRRLESRQPNVQGGHGGEIDPIALAASHETQGRPHEAVRLLKQLLAREPSNASAHDRIGAAYHTLGRRNDALRHFREAFSLGLYGLRGGNVLLSQSPTMVDALGRFSRAYPRPLPLAELLGPASAVA